MQVILTANALTGAIIYSSPDEECLADWVTKGNLSLLYNSKDAPSFFSGGWNTGTNPNLVLESDDLNKFGLERRMLEEFPSFQHQSLLITASKNLAPVPNEPYKRWNFFKANWELYGLFTNQIQYLRNYHLPTLALLMGIPGLL